MDVYWTIDHKIIINALSAQTPELVLKNKPRSETGYNSCPAFIDYFHNVYGWKAMYAYSLETSVDGHEHITDSYNCGCNWDSDVHNQRAAITNVRSVDEQLINIVLAVSFVTDSPSLQMSMENPYFEDNKFTSSCYVIPGTMDIGKYYRGLDLDFRIKENHNRAAFDEGDIIYYLRFHTPEKINFKQYFMSDKLREYGIMIGEMKSSFSSSPRPLSFFYDKYKKFNLQSKIMKEIKENLI
tara:strand:- start:1255 stop:1974 length:720 start_codon:yes stop_codon:yes gene_type:complete